MGAVLHLERDESSIVKWLRHASSEYDPDALRIGILVNLRGEGKKGGSCEDGWSVMNTSFFDLFLIAERLKRC